jgi:hypothetical protein
MHNKRLLANSFVAVIAAAAAPLAFFGPPPLRVIIIGMFLLTGPGGAFVLLLGINRRSTSLEGGFRPLLWSLTFGFSLAITAVTATIMLYVHWWHPSAAVVALSVLTLGLIAFGSIRARRRWAVPRH